MTSVSLRPRRRGHSWRAAAVATALTAACITVWTAPANAAPPAGPQHLAPQPAASGADAQAQATAIASGKPVTVEADTTAYSQTVAQADGSFVFTTHQQPQRVQKNGVWVGVDATLTVNTDGTWSPRAAESGLRLSGGGRGPLVTLDDGDAHRLSVSMPMALPTPTISGSRATYLSVLPGVDLTVVAEVSGGIREVLVVHDAAAAANPALATLTMATAATNLRLVAAPGGAIDALDSTTGEVRFTAPPATMWDSSAPAAHSRAAAGGVGAADGANVGGDASTSSVDGPGSAATITAIPLTATATAVTLRPSHAALVGADTTYPKYLDPSFGPAASADAYTQSFHTTTTAYNPTDDLKVGFDDWTTNCGSPCYKDGIARSYLRYAVSAIDGKTVTSTKLQLNEIRASCSGSYVINASITNGDAGFTSSLDWANQPAISGVSGSLSMNGTAGGKQMDVQNIGAYAALHNYGTLNVVLYSSSETDHCTYRHFSLDPTISFTYWSTPATPTNLTQMNGTGTSACATASPGTWIPAATGNAITLNDRVSSPDVGFALNSNMYTSANGGGYVVHVSGITAASGGTPISTALSVVDGSTYAWYATASNVAVTSALSATCYFRYDATAPSGPTITSSDYPAVGPASVAAGGSGLINFASVDAGTNPSGIASYNYNLNGTSISTGGAGEHNQSATSLSVALSSLHWGTNTLWVQSVDTAGNVSTPAHYDFYVQQGAFGPYTAGTAGDIDGDNVPDLVTIDATGNVRLFRDPDTTTVNPTGDTGSDPLQYGGAVLIDPTSPPNPLWPGATLAGALVVHAGSFHGNNDDDLVIQHGGVLAVAANPHGAGTWTTTEVDRPATCAGSCANYNAADWSSVLAMVAVPTAVDGAPDLVTVENFNGVVDVWLYTPHATVPPAFNPPVLISTSYPDWLWTNVQLLGAGPLTGTTGQTLWVRTLGTGDIDTFANITAGISGDPLTATHARIASGYLPAQYPLLTTTGRADNAGNLPLWATTATGTLDVVPTTTTAGVTTAGAPIARSAAVWASHEVALGASYMPYNNRGFVTDGTIAPDAFDVATSNQFAYSTDALATATLENGASSACPWATCVAGVAPGYWVITGSGDVFTLPTSAANTANNYAAAGQLLAAPIDSNGDFADHISFLGAGTSFTGLGMTAEATVTFTDGNTQTIPLTFADWTFDTDSTPIAGVTTLVATNYRVDTFTGAQPAKPTYLTATTDTQLLDNGLSLQAAGVQIATVTLPNDNRIHIFSIAVN